MASMNMTTIMVCYAPKMTVSKGVWMGENPLKFSVPLFMLQLLVIISSSRLLHIFLKPFRQPRAISEILCGIILGPTVLGRSTKISETLFPIRSVVVYDTMANMGLVYNFFVVGIEMDLFLIFRAERRAVAIAIFGTLLSFVISCSSSHILQKGLPPMMSEGSSIVFLALAMSISAFPMLARMLIELKIHHMQIGKLAMASSFINDISSWVITVIIFTIEENKTVNMSPIWVILCSATFVAFCILVIRPAIWLLIRQTPEGESFSEVSICIILTGVMISGFITEAIGMHAIFGAFVYGLVIPNGPLGAILIEKLEDFVTGILLPLYYAGSGIKARIIDPDGTNQWVLLFIIVFTCIGKDIGTLLAAMYYDMPLREAATLGFLMNAKGLIQIVVLNVGVDHRIIDRTSYTIMVFTSVFMIGITVPIVTMIYKPARKLAMYRGRAIERANSETELRILVVIHTSRSVPTIINLLEATNSTEEFPLCVYVLHLAELTGRASAMLVVHGIQETGGPAINKTQAQSDHIIKEFKNLEQHMSCVSVKSLTAISPYSTMHEDICNLAENKQVAVIIIPFHKQLTVDGEMTSINPDIQTVNEKVIENAVCSIGILVDRGLSGFTHLAGAQVSHHIAVLFFGGPDDREALAFALRMAQHPNNSLTVIRFLPGEAAAMSSSELRHNDNNIYSTPVHIHKEKQIDDEYISDFRMEVNNESLIYAEKVVNSSEETVAAVRSVDDIHDLFIVGKGQGILSMLTEGLTDWTEYPELGAIGDLLISPDFPARVSVLVLQHCIR